MAHQSLTSVLNCMRSQAFQQEEALLTDGQLLERYLANREAGAFEALVRRHGPMVLGVCRRVVANRQDAEDAFQATFLVLVRKAASVRPCNRVGNWLYGVAYRAALKARAAAVRQSSREIAMNQLPEPASTETGPREDLLALLDQEVNALPEKYRLPLVLCDLEGKTRNDAARHLGWPAGTVAGRLARARSLLARRMMRHGVPVSGGGLTAVLSPKVLSAGVPASLASSLFKAASQLAAGHAGMAGAVSARVATLTEGLLKSMLLNKLKSVTLVLVVLTTMTLGGVLLARGQRAGGPAASDRVPGAENSKGAADKTDDQEKDRPQVQEIEKEVARIQGTWRKTSLETEGRKNARFSNIEPLYLFQGNQFVFTDDYNNVGRKGTIKLVPRENALDLIVSEGTRQGKTLHLRYELDGDTLRLAADEATNVRPSEMKTATGSTIQIYTLRREPAPRTDDKQQLQGSWTVTSHDISGKEATKEFLAREHQWIFADDKVTMRDKEGIGREGVFRLDLTTNPRSLDLIVKPGLKPERGAAEPKEEFSRCIYLVKDDTLTVCYAAPGAARPSRFVSKAESGTGVVIFRRASPPQGN